MPDIQTQLASSGYQIGATFPNPNAGSYLPQWTSQPSVIWQDTTSNATYSSALNVLIDDVG